MVNKRKHNAFSLVELLVVLGIIAALAAIAIPSIKAMQRSFDSTGAESMISTALSAARTIAISKGKYAGVRFQKIFDGNENSLDAEQYMIFVINDEDMGTLADAFRAVEGYKPIKLPENTGVLDMMVRTNNGTSDSAAETASANETKLQENHLADAVLYRTIRDTSAFSIVFSPSGKLVIHDIRTRNKKGDYRPKTPVDSGNDMVFNSPTNIKRGVGMFVQDDYADLGLGGEKSRNKFYIYNREKLKKLSERYEYLSSIKPCTLNPYTGEIVNSR